MMPDVRSINERRAEILREVEANRMAKKLRGVRRGESRISTFMREIRLDFLRFVGVFRRSGKVANRKGRL